MTRNRIAFLSLVSCLVLAGENVRAEPPIERPLYVYIIEGAPLAANADAHIKRAVEIWSKRSGMAP